MAKTKSFRLLFIVIGLIGLAGIGLGVFFLMEYSQLGKDAGTVVKPPDGIEKPQGIPGVG